MADSKITALTAISTVDPTADPLVIVDVSDTSMAASGTTKKITSNQILGAGGTATLASATITGDLTVATNTLKTTSGNVGIGTVTPDIFSRFYTRTIGFNSSGSTVMQINGSSYSGIDLGAGGTRTFGIASSATDASLTTLTNIPIVFGINGTTAMTLNASGLGVGVSPANDKLLVSQTIGLVTSTTADINFRNAGNAAIHRIRFNDSNGTLTVGSAIAGTSYPVELGGNPSARAVTIDSSSNVGIGVTPSAWSGITALQISRGSFASDTGSYTLNQNVFNNGSNRYIATAAAMQFQAIPGTGFLWNIAPSGTAGNAITFTQAMTLDASGNLLVGTTASGGQNGFCVLRPLSAAVVATTTETAHNFGALTGTTYATFLYATTAIGSITQNGTTGVLYNINSDYRLKESVAPLSGGLARVNALKPSIYKWKSDGSSGEGFLAHELAEVVPAAVTGEKDAVNEDGSIKSQGIDMSRVVPILVAAIQELTAEVNALKKA